MNLIIIKLVRFIILLNRIKINIQMLRGINQMSNKWDRRFLSLAKEVSTWSEDPNTKVGAVIVGVNKQVISQGYNGFPRGYEDSEGIMADRLQKLQLMCHAEANAIYNALYNGASVLGATIYIHGLPPCHECAKAIIQCGINRVVYYKLQKETKWKESCELATDMFRQCGITVEVLKNE